MATLRASAFGKSGFASSAFESLIDYAGGNRDSDAEVFDEVHCPDC